MTALRFTGLLTRSVLVIALTLVCVACQTGSHGLRQARIDKLFEKTRPVCFGRFVIDVPEHAIVVLGSQTFGGRIDSFPNDTKALADLVSKRVAELKSTQHEEVSGSLLREVNDGPTAGSKTVIAWSSPVSTYVTLVEGYLVAMPHGFIYKGGVGSLEKRTLEDEKSELAYIASHLRARDPKDVPAEPGVCLDVGFIADDSGKFQEIFGAGLRFPELPDVSFSVSSNKDAQQGDSFEDRRAEARFVAFLVDPLGTLFNRIKTLREGKLKVQQGLGSEALFRRPMREGDGDGHWHEFHFEYAGKQYDHHNPPWDAALFTGVASNLAGAEPTDLTDDEALALWDRLMSSVRLRVP